MHDKQTGGYMHWLAKYNLTVLSVAGLVLDLKEPPVISVAKQAPHTILIEHSS